MGPEKGKQFESSFLLDIMEGMNLNIYITDIETDQIVYMNEMMKQTFLNEHPEGRKCWEVLQKNKKERCSFCKIEDLLKKGEGGSCAWNEVNEVTGRIYKNFDRIFSWNGKKYFVQCSSDVTDFVKLTESAGLDDLTKMMNRRAGKEKLQQMVDKARGRQKNMTVVLCDINELKQINDLYGNSEGDHLLRYFSAVLRKNMSGEDFVFRLSGDEFVLAYYGQGNKTVEEKVHNIREQLEQDREQNRIFYPVSFSYGMMEIYPADNYTVEDIIYRTDELMYVQKRNYHIRCQKERLKAAGIPQVHTAVFDYDKDRLYEALADSTDDYIFVGNMKSGVFRYPPAMVQEFGLPGEIVEQAAAFWGDLIHPHDEQGFLESNQEIADGRAEYHNIEYRARNVRGEWIWLRCRGRMMRDEKGEPWLFAGMITNLGKHNKVDHLTGLYNRFEFEGDIKKNLVDNDGNHWMELMILDLDSFKNINDLYNRSFGDDIIRITAHKIEALLPEHARLYRLDGDEFGIIFLDGEGGESSSVFTRIQRQFHRQQEHNGRKYYCTLSAGCVSYPRDAETYLDLMKYANYSLEYSKLMGKNRLTIFSPDILKKKERKLELTELLRESIERGFTGFSVAYQPQVHMKDGSIYGAEALARWQCGKYGEVSPGEFIPLLEQNGLMIQFGKWIFCQAVAQCRKWQEKRPGFHMSVNLSYKQLMDQSILKFMKETLEKEGLSPGSVTMELTETYLAQEDGMIHRLVKGMQEMGMDMAMDDFGTGYSSLVSLKKIPVDLVKIDQGFVRNIQEDLFNATVIRSITELCHDVGKMVCLEGIETEQEYQAVKGQGIELIQGYYFGRPAAPQQFEEQFLKSGTI